MRVALYARVSTEEQARHGLSIDTQLMNLREWAEKNGHTVTGEYIDAGISGKKPPAKRPAMSRFFSDLEAGEQIDALAFVKLDRFFRSVKLYYQAVDIMDKHRCGWIAVREDYETMTAGGRMKVNIMLSVAENEADRTSERIKDVFERKRERKEPTTHSFPIGYKVEGKRVVLDENAEKVKLFFQYYEHHGSIRDAMYYMQDYLGLPIVMSTARNLLKNRVYTGEYRGIKDFCPVIIPAEEFEMVQEMLKERSIRHNKTNRVYIFSGLVICKECGRKMIGHFMDGGRYKSKTYNGYNGYRCQRAFLNHLCGNRHYVNETAIERTLLSKVAVELDMVEREYTAQKEKKPEKKIDRPAIQRKIERLKDLYLDDLITKEQYKVDFEKYKKLLREAENAEKNEPDFSGLRKVISGTLSSKYEEMPREDKRAFWRSVIDHVTIDADKNMEIFFRFNYTIEYAPHGACTLV